MSAGLFRGSGGDRDRARPVPRVRIRYRRPPDGSRVHTQELLHDGPRYKLTRQTLSGEGPPLEVGEAASLGPGSTLLWFTYPDRGFEVAACYHPDGDLAGYYTNLVAPPRLEEGEWHLDDRWLDVWQPAAGEADLLDEDELEEAVERGWIDEAEAARVRGRADRVLRLAAVGSWPPAEVKRTSTDDLRSLRFRRDRPGAYRANLASGRVIAFGMYFMIAASVTSVIFSAFTHALSGNPREQAVWLSLLTAEALVLLPLSLGGALPATRRSYPREAMTERSLFLGAVVTAGAVLLVNEARLWSVLLAGVYGSLAFFLAVFAACRAWWDREFPGLALSGAVISVAALLFLL